MAFRNKKLLAIDWDHKDLRMALVRAKGKDVELLKAVSVPVPPSVVTDDPESLGAFVREAMSQAKISARSAILSIPREQVVLNTLNLPPTPFEEMASIVQFQVAKELPFSADQAVIDFAVSAEHDATQPCTVLVAAVRNEDLAFYRKVASEAGVSIERMGLRPYANRQAVLASLPELRDRSMLLVEVGPQHTEIDVVESGALTFSRAAMANLPEFQAPETPNVQDSRITKLPVHDLEPDDSSREAVNALLVEVTRSFEAYRATDATVSIDAIVVSGSTGLESQLAESLAARFAVRSMLFAPDRALALSPQRAKELRGFSAVLGLAMSQGAAVMEGFDFLHPKKPVSKRTLRLKKAPAAIGTAILVIGAGLVYHVRFIQPEKDKVAEVQEYVDEWSSKKKSLETFKTKVDALQDWESTGQVWPEVLVTLTNAFPDEKVAWCSNLKLEVKKRELEIQVPGRRRPRKVTKRLASATMKFETVDLRDGTPLLEKWKEMGFQDAFLGSSKEIQKKSIYGYERSINAFLPSRVAPKIKPPVEDTPIEEPVDPEVIDPEAVSGETETVEVRQPDEDAERPEKVNAPVVKPRVPVKEADDAPREVIQVPQPEPGDAPDREPATSREPIKKPDPAGEADKTAPDRVAEPETASPPRVDPKRDTPRPANPPPSRSEKNGDGPKAGSTGDRDAGGSP